MTSVAFNRDDLIQAVSQDLGRELSARTVMFHASIAQRIGLSTTDHKALDLLMRNGAMTAGELSELTQLTTGAVTGTIDRLETAGFVRREKDAKDRRKVIVKPITDRVIRSIAPLFDGMSEGMTDLCSKYTDRELILIQEFMNRCITLLTTETSKLSRVEETKQPKVVRPPITS